MNNVNISAKNVGGRKGFIDISDETFGRLHVIRRATTDEVKAEKKFSKCTSARWICQCDCGARKMVLGTHLRRGKTLSCGAQACADRTTTFDKVKSKRWDNNIILQG